MMPKRGLVAQVQEAGAGVRVGDRIRFTPDSHARNSWLVRTRDERYIVATRQAPFMSKGTLMYTVVDLVGWNFSRNGAGPGVVRAGLDILGGGWGDGSYDDAQCAEILFAVVSGAFDLSRRYALSVRAIERLPSASGPRGRTR